MQRLNIYLITLVLSAVLCKAGAQENQSDHSVSPSDTANTEIRTGNQVAAPFIIRNIVIVGNRKTKASVILR